MKIAVTYDNGQVFQHFGHTQTFKVYDVENEQVVSTHVVTATEGGHSALATLLQNNAIDVLICGGIGGGAQNALKELGIRLFGGVTGDADKAVDDFLHGTLAYVANVRCNHFDEHHGGEEHHHCHGAHGCTHSCK